MQLKYVATIVLIASSYCIRAEIGMKASFSIILEKTSILSVCFYAGTSAKGIWASYLGSPTSLQITLIAMETFLLPAWSPVIKRWLYCAFSSHDHLSLTHLTAEVSISQNGSGGGSNQIIMPCQLPLTILGSMNISCHAFHYWSRAVWMAKHAYQWRLRPETLDFKHLVCHHLDLVHHATLLHPFVSALHVSAGVVYLLS